MADDAELRSALAGRVWISTVVYCAALAAVAMTVTLLDALRSDFSPAIVAWLPVFVGTAAVVGWVVGAVVGIPISVVVTFGHRWLGVRAVTILIPLVILAIAMLVVYGWFGTRSSAVLGLTAVLTLVGGAFVAFRYERLAAASRVH